MRTKKAGITMSEVDKVQPFRVWHDGKIIWFARSLEEAERVLKEREYESLLSKMRSRDRGKTALRGLPEHL